MSSINNRTKRGFNLNFNQVPGPSTSEYYEKFLNDLHVNKLIFSDDGPEYPFNINDLVEIETIATTRHVIKRMKHKPSKKEMAVKFVHIPHNRHSTDDENLRKLKHLVREIQIFRELRNEPNIVRFYGFCLYEGQALICMELMDLSLKELSLKFIESGQKFPEDLLCCIIVAVLKSLVACKSKNIIHRDVRPDNILLSRDGAIKLCDFGESRILHDSLASTFEGALSYWPPERFEHEKAKLDILADIWSLGITLIEIVTGSVPYRDRKGNVPNNIILLQNLIVNLDTNKTVEEAMEGYTEGIKDFMKSCLKKVEERPKYLDLMATQFYKFCEKIELEKVVQILLKKHFYQDLSVEEIDTSEPNVDTPNENSIRTLNNIKENLEEILTIDNMAQLRYKCDTMFYYFYNLEISGQAQIPDIFKLAEEQFKNLIFQNAEKFLYYFIGFTEFVSRTNGDGRELDSLNICQTRSGIQCFIDMFGPSCFEENEDLRILTREEDSFIEELDERIKIWHKYFYCLNKDQIDSYFFEGINRVKHW